MSSFWNKLFRLSVDLESGSSHGSSGSASSNSSSEGLASSRFRHANWSDLPELAVVVTNDREREQLRAPRVRQGPLPGDAAFEGLPTEAMELSGMRVTSEEGDLMQQMNRRLGGMETWEHCAKVNLSYQNLGDPYQQANFRRIVSRLTMCKHLSLIDNHLATMSSHSLPSCEHLVLTKNHLKSFKQLPKLPRIKHLSLADNSICSLDGLKSTLGKTSLISLKLTGNAVVFTPGYRDQVFAAVPSLEVLDGILRPRPRAEDSAAAATQDYCDA